MSTTWIATARCVFVALLVASALSLLAAVFLRLVGLSVPGGVSPLMLDVALLVCLVPIYRSADLCASDIGLRLAPGGRSVGLVLLALVSYVYFGALWGGLVRPGHLSTNLSSISRQDTIIIVLAGFTAVLASPVVEEVFFRGFLYRSLRNRHGILPASVIAGLLFGLWHFQYPLIVRPELAFFGIVTALTYEYTASLLPGIALHSFIDGSGFDIGLTGNDHIVVTVFAIVACGMLFWAIVQACWQWIWGSRIRRHRETM